MDKNQIFGLMAVLVLIGSAIYFLEGMRAGMGGDAEVVELAAEGGGDRLAVSQKESRYDSAKEIASPSGFINIDNLQLADLIGRQVILVDFWTYSCINCQRTQPYLNAWQEAYGDKGLTIVGVHTPEFEFEKDIENVRAAVTKAGIVYPVVLDNDYATWRAYGNRYWPRKYLIDIDGYIVYDHIGEGGYEETEQVIQDLLAERADRLGEAEAIDRTGVQVTAQEASEGVGSPEVYFGSQRNELLTNGEGGVQGEQTLTIPPTARLNELLLGGTWDIQPELAVNTSSQATIVFRYKAKDVFMVAASDGPTKVTVRRDGQLIGQLGGEDVDSQSTAVVDDERLYHLVSEDDVGEHTLELTIEGAGLQAFTFTFG